MRELRIGNEDIPVKVNTQKLSYELAQRLGIDRTAIGVNYRHAGSVTVFSGGVKTESPTSVELVLQLPDEANLAQALMIVKDHRPGKTDQEGAGDVAEAAFRENVVIREILNRLDALEKKK